MIRQLNAHIKRHILTMAITYLQLWVILKLKLSLSYVKKFMGAIGIFF